MLLGGDEFRFTRGLIAFRRAHPILSKEQFYTDAGIYWFGPHGGLPNWADPKCKQLACRIDENGQDRLCLMFNAGTEETDFGLPPLPPGCRWRLAADTSRPTCLPKGKNRSWTIRRRITWKPAPARCFWPGNSNLP
jgi:pullulanase/glycogen debranching enzyme